jgi:hypothetical protein
MVARQKLAELAQRKRLLMAECDLHRALITQECQQLGQSLRWVDTGVRWARKLGPLLPVVAAVGGIAAVRQGGGLVRFAMKAFSGYQLVRGLLNRKP